MIFKGKWMPWDKESRKQTFNQIVDALIKCKNVRQKAAKYLNISRHKFYKLMGRFPEMDWNKEYPTPKPFSNSKKPNREVMSKAGKKAMQKRMASGEKPFQLTKEQEAKRKANREKHNEKLRAEREVRLKKQVKLVKEALSKNNNKRNKAADYLGWKINYLNKIMRITKHLVNWSTEYPNNHIRKIYR